MGLGYRLGKMYMYFIHSDSGVTENLIQYATFKNTIRIVFIFSWDHCACKSREKMD